MTSLFKKPSKYCAIEAKKLLAATLNKDIPLTCDCEECLQERLRGCSAELEKTK